MEIEQTYKMQVSDRVYDCGIVGGGLAGLCLAAQLADNGIRVVLFERNQYPFHKVCGEYISMESWNFLNGLGLPLPELGLPFIDQLGISSEKGFMLNHALKPGGFGISRYSLDGLLSKLAVGKDVTIVQNCKVGGVRKIDAAAHEIETSQGLFRTRIICGSYGKYAPSFIQQEPAYIAPALSEKVNYIGVKYHIKADLPGNRIELHNFKDGYCGISKVDQDWHCLCYLTTAGNLQENGKDIKSMEEQVLYKNPFLKTLFTRSEFVNPQPLVISNIHFSKKQTDVNGVFLLGDAAGSITPLCGNGMSMAMRGSKLLATELVRYFENKQSENESLNNYQRAWDSAFKARITAGYYLQYLFGKRNTTDYALKFLDKVPALTRRIVSLTHGEMF